MKPVFQTRFEGSDEPDPLKRGNCFAACLASILEISLEDVHDPTATVDPSEHWFDVLNVWLARFGLGMFYMGGFNGISKPLGYHMMSVKSIESANPEDEHIVVIKDLEVVHNPNPNNNAVGEPTGLFILVPLDASKERTDDGNPSEGLSTMSWRRDGKDR